jgi:hypothetical protein
MLQLEPVSTMAFTGIVFTNAGTKFAGAEARPSADRGLGFWSPFVIIGGLPDLQSCLASAGCWRADLHTRAKCPVLPQRRMFVRPLYNRPAGSPVRSFQKPPSQLVSGLSPSRAAARVA